VIRSSRGQLLTGFMALRGVSWAKAAPVVAPNNDPSRKTCTNFMGDPSGRAGAYDTRNNAGERLAGVNPACTRVITMPERLAWDSKGMLKSSRQPRTSSFLGGCHG
jgi:hypothetical protein